MSTQKEHYERLLAQHYSWMVGLPFEDKVAEQTALLADSGVSDPGSAIDLGCGPGYQSVALTDLGATHVHAIDTSAALLDEMEGHVRDGGVTMHQADLMDFDVIVGEPVDTCICMGDTLTHLTSKSDVALLFRKISDTLRPGGRLVLSWRDLSHPPRALDRFIPVRSTGDRVMVCFLEDQGERVLVHDLVHVRVDEQWQFQRSAYPKLKLSSEMIASWLDRVGLVPESERTSQGMTVLAACKPA